MPRTSFQKTLVEDLYLSSACYPFEKNPFISNLPHTATTLEQNIKFIIDVTGEDDLRIVKPYLNIKKKIQQTGEIFFELKSIGSKEEIKAYNDKLDAWEIKKGYQINIENDIVSIDSYEKNTISILKNLIKFSQTGNKGQKEFNLSFLKNNSINFEDEMKKRALSDVFVDSHLILIYGAAGTGKTTLINYISNLMAGKRKLFLTKTHTAKQNLKRRIDNPGADADFISIDSFAHKVSLPDYDIIFVDECSTIDNRIMCEFFKKINPETFLVLAGDVHQIGSIDFGNWFFYAKDIKNGGKESVVYIDCTDLIYRSKSGRWACKDIDVLISYIASATHTYIYYKDEARVVNNAKVISVGAKAFAELMTHVVDYVAHISSTPKIKAHCKYMAAQYYIYNILGKDVTESNMAIARKISGLSDREAGVVELQYDVNTFSNIKFFVESLSNVLHVSKLTLDVVVERWMYLYNPSTVFGLEMFPAFASMITDCYIGSYLNNQKTIEKILGNTMVEFAKIIFKIGEDAV